MVDSQTLREYEPVVVILVVSILGLIMLGVQSCQQQQDLSIPKHIDEECYDLPSGFKTQRSNGWQRLNAADRMKVERLVVAGKAEKELETTGYCLVYETRGNQTDPKLVVRKFWWWRALP